MKLKRLLTAALSAVMALSVCAMPAMAETTSTSTINPDLQGSITIHKYLMEHTDDNSTKAPTNGEVTTDLPADATPAADVGFTLYQVMDYDNLVEYFDGVSGVADVEVKDYFVGKDFKQGIDSTKVKKTVSELKTNANGEVTFAGLDLGLYVVVETSKPVTVTDAVDPFLVSVPMTRIGSDGKTIPNSWLYDIHVYPKNATSTGDITLEKKGVVGDSSDSNAKPLQGVQFKLERLTDGADAANDANWTTIPYSEASENYTTDQNGKLTAKSLLPGTYRFTEIGYTDDAPDKSYIINNGDKYVFEVAADGTVTPKAGADHSDDYTANDKIVTVYNYRPDLDKQVNKRDSDDYKEAADYNVGDMIKYKITVKVPHNIAQLATFDLTDTPVNLKDDVNTIKVYDDTNTEITTGFNKNANGDGFIIKFTPATLASYAGKTLTVEYEAELLNTAVMTTDGNPNTAKLVYSNKAHPTTTPGVEEPDSDKTTISDDAVVYTFQIQINKTGENGTPLKDVKFDLYKVVAAGTEGALTPAEAKALGFENTDTTTYKKIKTDITTDGNGKVSVDGLANGKYYLVETLTNEGYNLLAKPVEVILSIQYEETWTETKEYENGVLVKHDYTKKSETQGIGAATTTIVNRKGFTLPRTGGFGTLLFSGIGVLLVLAGVSVLFSLKKKNTRA